MAISKRKYTFFEIREFYFIVLTKKEDNKDFLSKSTCLLWVKCIFKITSQEQKLLKYSKS